MTFVAVKFPFTNCFCHSVAVVVNGLDRKQQKLPLVTFFFLWMFPLRPYNSGCRQVEYSQCNWNRYELILNIRAKNSGV